MDDPLYIVFYGTLMVDSPQFKEMNLDHYLVFTCDCEIAGKIYDTQEEGEHYPGLVPGSGTVKGQLFEIRDPSFLTESDKWEEFNASEPSKSLYLRKAMHLKKPDVDAWIYVYNKDVSGCPEIKSGDWNAYLQKIIPFPATEKKPSAPKFGT